MLTLAANAAAIIRRLTRRVESDAAGLRIVPAPHDDALALELAVVPRAGETVLESDGARVFLDRETVEQTRDLELYAFAENGAVHLAMRPHT